VSGWRTKEVKRTQRILQAVGATACPESWYSFEISLLRTARVLTYPEAHRKHPTRRGCGSPPESSGCGMQEQMRRRTWEAPLAPGCGKAVVRYTDNEARKGKPGDGAMPEPKRRTGKQCR
jgi:hypothetical protein